MIALNVVIIALNVSKRRPKERSVYHKQTKKLPAEERIKSFDNIFEERKPLKLQTDNNSK